MGNAVSNLLESVPESERCLVSTVLVLTELAHADKAFDSRERETIVKGLCTLFKAENSQVEAHLASAIEARLGGTDLARLSRILSQQLSQPERNQVVEAMWRVVMADGTVDTMEQRLADSMSLLLGVSYEKVAEIRQNL
jgi:uncharacterized tellurite resistance protein B-like protein